MKEFIDYVSGRLQISNKQLLEKDIILHSILLQLSKTDFFDDFMFKGGTCLTKCYLGYYRFSEDLDFTYSHQGEFEGKSQKGIRKLLSKKIDAIASMLHVMCKSLDLKFDADKSSKKYIELGGSNKLATFKLWYVSEMLGIEQFIKIQINFVEKIFFKSVDKKALMPIGKMKKNELKLLFPQYSVLLEDITIPCYDIREIFIEKIRAILTRRGIKSRDFIDVYLIAKKYDLKAESFEKQIIAKVKFVLQYDKYIQNISSFDVKQFVLGEEEKLLLKPLGRGFAGYVTELLSFINELSKLSYK